MPLPRRRLACGSFVPDLAFLVKRRCDTVASLAAGGMRSTVTVKLLSAPPRLCVQKKHCESVASMAAGGMRSVIAVKTNLTRSLT